MSNPFFYGNPVPFDKLIDRHKEIRRIVGRILNQCQSTAIVGEPRSGKTSLLLYLAALETRKELYGADSKRMLFSFLDAQTFGGKFSQAQFWERVLRPLQDSAVNPSWIRHWPRLTRCASPMTLARSCWSVSLPR